MSHFETAILEGDASSSPPIASPNDGDDEASPSSGHRLRVGTVAPNRPPRLGGPLDGTRTVEGNRPYLSSMLKLPVRDNGRYLYTFL
ncbi:hypothetical protein [Cerasicoccus fimbriatus]|uniref:hypothetical protein n=1 Tax=Cerasicoccus fimbriatus TaxID=3014554 RepID=UPI0022B2DA4A|nr:hypothetical protein [Cerasicoccus sp. TK19100]